MGKTEHKRKTFYWYYKRVPGRGNRESFNATTEIYRETGGGVGQGRMMERVLCSL